MKRSGKFYRKNEKEVMESLGLKATYNSGSGWIEKEDGQNEFIICQLKSTDAQSIKVNQKDLHILEHNASISHKIPVFAIQFLNTNEVWIMIKPESLNDVSEYLETGKVENIDLGIKLSTKDILVHQKPIIKSSNNARQKLQKEREEKYNKIKSAK